MMQDGLKPITAIVAAILVQDASCSAYSQTAAAPVTVLSKTNTCNYTPAGGPPPGRPRYRFGCLATALIIDPPQDRRISCYISISATFRVKSGPDPNTPTRLVVDSHSDANSGYCFIQPGLGVPHPSIFPLDTGQKEIPARVNIYLIYDGVKVTACINPSSFGRAILAASETVCNELRIRGDF